MMPTFISVTFIAGFNYIIDPYDIFNTNTLTKYSYNNYRITNALRLKFIKFNNIIIGTSRTRNAINPDNINFQGKTYNLSMEGTNVYEIKQVFDFISENQNDLDTIVYGVDFLTFSDKRYPGEQFNESLYNKKNYFYKAITNNLLSLTTFKRSIESVFFNFNHIKSNYIDGYIDQNTKNRGNQKVAFEKILTNNFLVNPETYGCYNYSEERLKLFDTILKTTTEKNINLKLFIPPLQYRQYMALYHLGLFDIYLKWIKDISQSVNQVNNQYGTNLVELYDFSGINYITTEKIPKNINHKMRYHFESSHYTSNTGDIILDRLYGKNTFGYKLNNIDINDYLHIKKEKILKFFDGENDTFKEIENMYFNTIPKRKINCKKYNTVLTKIE